MTQHERCDHTAASVCYDGHAQCGNKSSVSLQLPSQVPKKPANAWRKIKKSCLLFTTSRPNIGPICERLTPSNPLFTVGLRTHRTKGCGSRIATLTMVFKL